MRSIHDIVKQINQAICSRFDAKTYGIATMSTKGENILPSDDEKYIGLDDIYKIQIYHKLNSMNNQLRTGSGYGDSRGDQVNTFNMSMIVFHNERLTKFKTDQLVLVLQANTPRDVVSEYFKTIRLTYNNVVLNDAVVWQQEYGQSAYKLKPHQRLIQINYTVEATYKEGCFAKCLEDLCNN